MKGDGNLASIPKLVMIIEQVIQYGEDTIQSNCLGMLLSCLRYMQDVKGIEIFVEGRNDWKLKGIKKEYLNEGARRLSGGR